MENPAKRFYMIAGPDGSPRIRHPSHAFAMDEATRLAKANPGKTFYVMHALEAVEAIDVKVTPL